MPINHEHVIDPDGTRFAARHAAVAIAVVAAFAAMFALAPPDDPTKVVSSLPCSILSERDIGAVVGARVRLMPTSGAICHYLPTDDAGGEAVFVVAHAGASLPERVPANGVAFRSSGRVYTIVVVPRDAVKTAGASDAQRLAKLASRPLIAANR